MSIHVNIKRAIWQKIKFTILALAILSFSTSCKKKAKPSAAPPVIINAVKAEKKDVDIYIDNIGHVESITNVKVQTRIEGELMKVHFNEGDEVDEGSLLFTIDPRPYEIELEKALGALEKNRANLALAKDKFVRNTALIKDDYISQIDYEQLASNVEVLQASIKENEADVEKARLDLSYCHIYAPITGKTGILSITEGNMIYPNDNSPIITVNQLAPIYVTFYMTEKNLPTILQAQKNANLKVHVAFEDLDKNYIVGMLEMIDNSVEKETGLIKLRAIFENDDRMLWPGKFVKTRLILKTLKNAIIIPYKAISITSSGPKVFVVKEDDTVKMKSVTLGQREGLNIIILSGVNENDEVVTDGQLNLKDGSKIYISNKKQKAK